jgi:hypothetical protein
VRGGKGKSQTQRAPKAAQSRGRAQGPKGSYGRGDRRDEARKPQRKGGQGGGSGSWIEGRRAVVEALDAGMPLRKALVSDGDSSLADVVRQLDEAGVPIERVPRFKLDSISSHGAHQGVIAQAAPFRYAELEDVIARAGKGDALVVLLTGMVFRDWNKALYTGITVFLCGKMVDAVVYRFDYSKVALIITKEYEQVAQRISDKLERGATYLHGEGTYSRKNTKVVLTAVKKQQLADLKRIVVEADPNAFVILQEAHQVLGDGFSRYSKDAL